MVCAFVGACALVAGISKTFGQITRLDGLGAVQSGAMGVNDQGVVVGDYVGPFDGPFSFRFTPATGMQQIPVPAGMTHTQVYDISENGTIVGETYTTAASPSQLFRSDGSTSFNLGSPVGSTGAIGYGVNNSGTIVGNFSDTNGGGKIAHDRARV